MSEDKNTTYYDGYKRVYDKGITSLYDKDGTLCMKYNNVTKMVVGMSRVEVPAYVITLCKTNR